MVATESGRETFEKSEDTSKITNKSMDFTVIFEMKLTNCNWQTVMAFFNVNCVNIFDRYLAIAYFGESIGLAISLKGTLSVQLKSRVRPEDISF